MTTEAHALSQLKALVAHGPRFHGTETMAAAAAWLESELVAMGHSVRREPVSLPGWHPGTVRRVRVTAPVDRVLPAWPMLWSAGTGAASVDGVVRGRLEVLGPEGIWGDSIVWQRFGVRDEAGRIAAVVHARDDGPAAPQPLPAGSDDRIAHLAVGHLDGLQLAEWVADHDDVRIEVELDSEPRERSVSDNLIVEVPGSGPVQAGTVVACGHLDSFYNTLGAYDNGSGSIALLELARIWVSEPPTRPVRIVWFTAEEWHLLGSRHHVEQLTDADRDAIDFVLNIDGLGRGDLLETFVGPERFGFAVRDAVRAHAAATARTLTTVDRFPPTRGTDDASFHAAGIPSVFLTFNDLHRLHQPEDLPDPGIARNIAWTVPLARSIVETMPRPRRTAAPGLL
ncbi:M20/M25/M40 family metallo-hydrolase [Curtobacterium sp. PhB146]|uniref:M20/M25/M40 family metallo-hydrolase n=1 Tax=Curtobacterium sp. PhB146 TaxID=2485187 RepID=UPI001046C498|nr:M20/M25/M40 family metallo-hydrolase [Curtobacterium sp. PhB146]TCU43768.1 peptidase M28-like protein [Curtobacterium sp. PhB146]